MTTPTSVVSVPDLIITIAYFSIPLLLVFSLLRHPSLTRNMAMTKVVVMLVLFALFIFLCGAGHLLRCMGKIDSTLFQVVNILTAIVSLTTAVCLIPIAPSLLADVDKSLSNFKHSKQIVDSMYPDSIKERLLKSLKTASGRNLSLGSKLNELAEEDKADATAREKQEDRRGSSSSTLMKRLSDDWFGGEDPAVRIRKFLKCYQSSASPPDFDVENEVSAPIADSFPSVSILFADIAGFTAWCARHEPDDVFELLENLFWEFDELAKELGVFKVETKGDCYIAACGVPDSRKDHAVVLTKFAELARMKTNMVLEKMAPELGPDTLDLNMRFGIHSGPVTAGVLRGHKSRFELFGDTINTSARMESTGKPNKIQLSQQTADLLFIDGKGDWLVPREGLVHAKGKGELQTYWVKEGFGSLERGHSASVRFNVSVDVEHGASNEEEVTDVTSEGATALISIQSARGADNSEEEIHVV